MAELVVSSCTHRFQSKVSEIVWKNDQVFELVVDRAELDFVPGDSVAIFSADQTISRPYSIASGIHDPDFRFLIQRLPGGEVSHYLSTLTAGDTVNFTAPFGWFRPGECNGAPFTFLATGTGITPFLSYLRSYPERPPKYCLYGAKYFTDVLDCEFLMASCPTKLAISREQENPHYYGRINGLLPDIDLDPSMHFYLCGLDAMIDDISQILEDAEIDFTHIHREVFFYAPS